MNLSVKKDIFLILFLKSLHFIQVNFERFFQRYFSVFTKRITDYLTSKNEKKTEKTQNVSTMFFLQNLNRY